MIPIRSAKQTRNALDSPTHYKYNFYNFGTHFMVVGAFMPKRRTRLARSLKRSYPLFYARYLSITGPQNNAVGVKPRNMSFFFTSFALIHKDVSVLSLFLQVMVFIQNSFLRRRSASKTLTFHDNVLLRSNEKAIEQQNKKQNNFGITLDTR